MLCGDTNKIMRKNSEKGRKFRLLGRNRAEDETPAHPLQGCRRALHRVFKGGDRSGDCHKTYALLCAILPSRFRREGHRLHNFRRHLQVVRRPSHRKQAGRRRLRSAHPALHLGAAAHILRLVLHALRRPEPDRRKDAAYTARRTQRFFLGSDAVPRLHRPRGRRHLAHVFHLSVLHRLPHRRDPRIAGKGLHG